ncbi:lysophospholipase-like protein 1 [Monomorium pharaonis]|uniref:lysophospholipase-like protein 1 n=1 Tax=Monomorium pharaonis TaxID=307658 RepID=UPI00063F7963|nr:lysophospholipase-like protein 1 [Monomorium pharaonis]XP_012538444.1 lysophospholipase-like protein 1 [Monomorium pharaonis]XP_012538446.1 lysophospholipase-like protein 1 [Monomorium pharaonis]
MATIARISQASIVQATKKHTATIFFFHGSGGTAENLKEWINILNREKLQFPHIKLIYPSAPSQAYTPNNGMMQNVWFDRLAISNEAPEQLESLDSMCQNVSEWIDREVANGIPLNRIILGGFSMGGCLALHLAYRYRTVAGCFAMSSFLNKRSIIYEHLKMNSEHNKIPLVQYHGLADSLVPIEWGEEGAKNLQDLGVNVTFIPLKNIEHDLSREEIQSWKDWLLNILPDK